MRNALIITACFTCLSLAVGDKKEDYGQYNALISEIPTAKVLVEQGKELDALERELSAYEVKMDSVK